MKIITKTWLDKRERRHSISLSGNNDTTKNAEEKDHRDFFIDGDLRPPMSSSLLIMIPRRFSRSAPLSTPSPPNIPDIIWTATVDHLSPSFSLLLVRLLRNSLSAEGEGWREEKGRGGRRRWKTSDVCPRGIVIFIGSQLSRGFSFFCPVVPCRRLLPLPCEKPAAMKIRCSLFAAERTPVARLDVSVVRYVGGLGRTRWSQIQLNYQTLYWTLTCKIIFICNVS